MTCDTDLYHFHLQCTTMRSCCSCSVCMYRYLSPTATRVGDSILRTSAAVVRRSPTGHQHSPQKPDLELAQTGCAQPLFRRQAGAPGHTPLKQSACFMVCLVLQTEVQLLYTRAFAQVSSGMASQLPQKPVSAEWSSYMQPLSMCSLLTLQTLASFLQHGGLLSTCA